MIRKVRQVFTLGAVLFIDLFLGAVQSDTVRSCLQARFDRSLHIW